jgi:hypothetical protein
VRLLLRRRTPAVLSRWSHLQLEVGEDRAEAKAARRPGEFTVRLTVNGQTYTQPVTIKPDPRTVTPSATSQ